VQLVGPNGRPFVDRALRQGEGTAHTNTHQAMHVVLRVYEGWAVGLEAM